MGSFKHFKKPERLGKIDSPLNDKLNQVKWGEFRLGDLFEVLSYQKRFDANKVCIQQTGKYPYIVRTAFNNGQKGYIDANAIYLNEGNTISFGQDTATAFYQPKPYFTGDKIKVLKSKNKEFSQYNALFFVTAITKSFSMFSWGESKFDVETLKEQLLRLPMSPNGTIDFGFIDEFVTELETERVTELDAYLNACNLKDYQLTKDEEEAINNFDSIKWEKFNIIDVFDVKNTSNLLSSEIIENSGNIPYLCASSLNNSVSTYISHDQSYLEKGNCIFIGGKTCEISYQEKDFFSNDSHNLALYLKKSNPTKLTQLYLATCLFKSLNYKYSWGNSISKAKIKNDIVSLPTKNNVPNYEDMQLLIKAVQKLVIKDVVDFADKKINATKQVIK